MLGAGGSVTIMNGTMACSITDFTAFLLPLFGQSRAR